MRVALDVTPELLGMTGVARYSRELGRALDEREDCELRRFAIGRRTQAVPAATAHFGVPLRTAHLAWRVLGGPRAEALAGRVDVVHSLDLLAPPTKLPLVVTVHDLVAAEHPELHPRRAVEMQRARLADVARATAVLAVSKGTADALVARGADRERIQVVPNGLTPLPPAVDPPVPRVPFVLAVGTLEPRKGHELLLRAFAQAQVGEHHLVFAGPTAGRADTLIALARELGVAGRLIILGAVDDPVLAGLYRDAAALCMPSLAEGFGLPALEAIAAGVPVVASDLPAVREVVGDAGLLFPPGAADALARELERVIADDAVRERLRRAGPDRAARFTWEGAAQKTAAAYARAVEEGPRGGPDSGKSAC